MHKRSLNNLLVYINFLLAYAVIFLFFWQFSDKQVESVAPVLETKQEVDIINPVPEKIAATIIQPAIFVAPEPEPEIITEDDPIVHQEAKEPEWGFDFEYVCRVVAAESRGEPYEGQLAVAQCIWNTSVAKGNNPDEVVKEKYQYAKPVSSKLVTESVRDACRNVFLGIESVTDEPIRYFYSTKGGFVSGWHERNLVYVMTIGNHKFFKEK